MENKKIKVFFLQKDITNLDALIRMLNIKGLPLTENFVWDEENPDYVFFTTWLYHDINSLKKFMKLAQKPLIRIYVTDECIAPDLNIFDYAIVFDKKLSDMDRVCSRPANLIWENYISRTENELTSETQAKSLLRERKRFCNFIYSNPIAHPDRDKLLHSVVSYKHVDSLGKHLNNIDALITCKSGNMTNAQLSILMKSKYKFSIASENARYEGYTSEKLLTSFEAHTVPIYWGNPYVTEEFNPEAFINCNDYKNFDDVVKRIKEIDEDDDLWAYMVSRPWQTEEQKKTSEELREKYLKFVEHIFSQPIEQAIRRPEGTFPGMYEQWFLKHNYYNPTRLSMIFTAPGVVLSRLKNKFIRRREIDINDFYKD